MTMKKITICYLEQSPEIDAWCVSFAKHLQSVFHSYISKEISFEVSGLANPSTDKNSIVVYNSSGISVKQLQEMNPHAVICFDEYDTALLSNVFMFATDTKEGREHYSADSEHFHNEYWVSLVDCAFAINHTTGAQSDKLPVYLGEAGEDQQASRDILRRELVQLGYSVLPSSHLPTEAVPTEHAIKEMLLQSVAAVLLVGTDPGKPVEATNLGIVEYQHTILRQYVASQKNSMPLVFLFEDFGNFTTDEQLAYLQRMQMSIDADSGAEVLQMPVEKFKQELLPIITAGIAKNMSSQHISQETIWYVVGRPTGTLFSSCIAAIEKTDVLLLLDERLAPAERLLQHRKHLATANKVILCYESQPSAWLIAMLQDILKAPGFGQKKAFDKIILMHTPQSALDMKMIFPYIKTLPLVEHECQSGSDMIKILKNSSR